jgi:hypothetical protein
VLTRPWRPGMSMLGWVSGQILLPVVRGKGGNVGTGVGAGTVAVGFTCALVGVAEGRAEGVTEGANVGGAGDAEAGRVAVGAGVAAWPHPAIHTPATIKSRMREASFRFKGQLLAAAAPRLGSLS